jgi:hypothetical protein
MIFDAQDVIDLQWLFHYLDYVDLPLILVAPIWLLQDALLVLVDMLKLLILI